MLPWLLFAFLGVFVGLVLGGRLKAVGDYFPVWPPLIAVVVRIGFGRVMGVWWAATLGPLIITILGLFIFYRRLPGIKLYILGALCNLLVVATNGGYMPGTIEGMVHAGYTAQEIALFADGQTFRYGVGTIESTYLAFLGDNIPLPFFKLVASPGDMIMGVGMFLLLLGLTLMPLDKSPHPRLLRLLLRT